MIQEGGSTPVMVSGGGGWGGDGCGGIFGIILVIALLGGGLGFGGFGRGRDGCGGGEQGYYNFGLQRDVLENKYTSERNTGVIVHNQDACTQKILDRMASDREFALMGKLNEAERLLSEQRIVCAVKAEAFPQRPVPAYVVAPPLAPYGYEQPRYDRGYGYPCGAPC